MKITGWYIGFIPCEWALCCDHDDAGWWIKFGPLVICKVISGEVSAPAVAVELMHDEFGPCAPGNNYKKETETERRTRWADEMRDGM